MGNITRMTLSFPETADIETSSDDYAKRFAGPTGEWMLGVQEQIVLKILKETPSAGILDVGGGHGQLVIPLCSHNFPVTVIAGAESCRKRISNIVESGACKFVTGNLIDLPFPDQSFDTVICIRFLTHCKQWPTLIKELCRVATHSVILDYPTSQSLNRIAPALFQAKKRIEGNTRTWRLFKHQEVLSAFEQHGFTQGRRCPQFFLPMILHRMFKCRSLSVLLEGICRAVGLTQLWGSPIILEVIRHRGGMDVK